MLRRIAIFFASIYALFACADVSTSETAQDLEPQVIVFSEPAVVEAPDLSNQSSFCDTELPLSVAACQAELQDLVSTCGASAAETVANFIIGLLPHNGQQVGLYRYYARRLGVTQTCTQTGISYSQCLSRTSGVSSSLLCPAGSQLLRLPSGDLVCHTNSCATHCPAGAAAGGDEPYTNSFEMGASSGTFLLSYQTYTIRDQIVVRHDGQVIFDTGCTGTGLTNFTATVPIAYSGTSTQVSVEVHPNCQPGTTGTAWRFGIDCPIIERSTEIRFGADTNSSPSEFPASPPLEDAVQFYLGEVNSVDDIPSGTQAPCSLVTFHTPTEQPLDVLTRQPIPAGTPICRQFVGDTAMIAPRDRRYAYWWLRGPADVLLNASTTTPPTSDQIVRARDYGVQQAHALIAQVVRYRAFLGGRTLFADIENGGFYLACVGTAPNSCDQRAALNEEVLQGFLRTLVASGYVPGVYTNFSSWISFFRSVFVPRYSTPLTMFGRPIPFVLWIASCGQFCNLDPDYQLAISLRESALNGVLGGSRAVIWQFYVPGPSMGDCAGGWSIDLNLTEQDPSTTFVPVVPTSHLPPTSACSAD